MVDKVKAEALAKQTQKERGAAFIAKARELHGDGYTYFGVEYVRANLHVTITCPTHGDFSQRPANHLRGQGCPYCAQEMKEQMGKDRRLTIFDFISKGVSVHGPRFDYSESVYVASDKPIDIKCDVHGTFTIARAEKHFLYAQGCPHCVSLNASSTPELIIAEALDEGSVVYFKEFKFADCVSPTSGHKLRFDFYIPERNLLIEFHGDQHFKRNKLMHKGDKFERMQEHDRVKAQYAFEKGITLVTFTSSNLASLRTCVEKLIG